MNVPPGSSLEMRSLPSQITPASTPNSSSLEPQPKNSLTQGPLTPPSCQAPISLPPERSRCPNHPISSEQLSSAMEYRANASGSARKIRRRTVHYRTSFCLPGSYHVAIDGEKDRHQPRCKSGPDDIPLLAVLLIWTLENGHPLQAKQDRGLSASTSRKSSCVAAFWTASGT